MLYLVLATFYDPKEKRAWPPPSALEDALPIPKQHRYRTLDELTEVGLVEYWRERVGRHRRKFYRLPYLDEKGHITGELQQPTWEALLVDADSVESAWVRTAQVVKARGYRQRDGSWGKLKRKARTTGARGGAGANADEKERKWRLPYDVRMILINDLGSTREDIERIETEGGGS
jgi:hypothetical protein